MDETMQTSKNAPNEAGLPLIELGKWMGRRDAFGQVAARCSAAEIESLRQIHDGRLYQRLNCTWGEFCAQHLRVSVRTVERELAHLRRFGPAFFTVRQLTRISADDYAAIAGSISEQGVCVNGETIALDLDNGEAVAGAVKALLEQGLTNDSTPAQSTFEAAMQRFRAASKALRSCEEPLDAAQLREVAAELSELCSAAAGWGVSVVIAG